MLSEGLLDSLRRVEGRIYRQKADTSIETATLLSPILNPEKILLVAANYASHVKDWKVKPPSEPYFFTRMKNSLIGPGEPILIPKASKAVDWEVELAVVIGKTGKYISRKNAMSYIAGYTISNDISFRDLQHSTGSHDNPTAVGMNWVKGKSLDSSFPLGPWLVTADEIQDPHNLDVSLSVNGEIKQHSNTKEMISKIDSLIEYVSSGITLRPGDIISTGTPEGVAVSSGGPYLKNGDIVECRIKEIGTLRNPVKSE
jgi:2-keto-4-pentenoate hydratase/2-oxohepta-3-ene-1,7-dioic acid hydratase in catechol pathway